MGFSSMVFASPKSSPSSGLLGYGFRYYDPVTGRWPSRDPIEERGGVNLYGFVGNNPVKYSDYLGLNVPDGFIGSFESADKAGYYGSRYSSMLTLKDPGEREFCGIICCRNNLYIISKPHAGPDRMVVIEDGKKVVRPGASCYPEIALVRGLPTNVKCPDEWKRVADYHSHPRGPNNEDFSGNDGDYEYVNHDDGLPLYLGTPSGKVKRLDKDKEGDDKDRPSHPGVEIPDTWGYEEKWRNQNEKK